MKDLTGYIQWMKLKHKAANTIKKYCQHLSKIPGPERFRKEYLANNNENRLLFAAYRSYLKYLYEIERVIDRNELLRLLDTYKLPPRDGAGETENAIAYPKPQWESIIEKGHIPCARMSIWLGFQFGFRAGEIANLRINDVDFDKEVIYVRARKINLKINQIAWHPKYRKNRTLALNYKQAAVFKKWFREIRPELSHPYVLWVGKNKRQVTIYTINYWCRRSMQGLRPHDLRRSFATNLYFATGKNVKAVQLALGHADIGTTSRYLRLGEKGYLDIVRKATVKMT